MKKKSRKMMLLMLPFLLTYLFQATQYARAPVKYSYYVVYAKSADIALIPGTDRSPDGNPLLRNSTIQQGLYNMSLGKWGPGYRINYTDAFHVRNDQAFGVNLISINFSADSTGNQYIVIYMKNDTDQDGDADSAWIPVYLGSGTRPPYTGSQLSPTNYIYTHPSGQAPVMLEIMVNETVGTIDETTPYSGTLHLWFTSTY